MTAIWAILTAPAASLCAHCPPEEAEALGRGSNNTPNLTAEWEPHPGWQNTEAGS